MPFTSMFAEMKTLLVKFWAKVAVSIDPLGTTMSGDRSEEHTSELQSHSDLVCRLLLEKKKKTIESMKPLFGPVKPTYRVSPTLICILSVASNAVLRVEMMQNISSPTSINLEDSVSSAQ